MIKNLFINLKNTNIFFSIFSVFIILFIFFAPTFIVGNEWAFISRALNFFNTNNNYIGYSDGNKAIWLKAIFFYFYNFFGYEIGAKIMRILALFLYSIALFYFSKSFKISYSTLIVGILLFIFLRQSFFLSENIFGTFEPKVIAYILVIFSLSFLQREKYTTSIFFISFAIYSHFLVGYFWLGVICFYHYLKKKNINLTFSYFVKIFIITIPMLLLLIYENYLTNSFLNEVDHNQIYVDRHQGLVTPFSENWFIKKNWLKGYLIIFIFTLSLFFLKKKIKNDLCKEFFYILLTLNLYFYFLLLILYFDRTYFFSKFTPYRPESLVLLFSLFYIIELIFIWFLNLSNIKKIIFAFIVISLTFSPMIIGSKYNLYRVLQLVIQKTYYVYFNINKTIYEKLEENEKKLLSWVFDETKKNDVILFEDSVNFSNIKLKDVFLFVNNEGYSQSVLSASSWETISTRPGYVIRDVIGSNIPEMIKWHMRMKEKQKIYSGNCLNLKDLPINYIVAFTEKSKENLKKCFNNFYKNFGKYNIYKNEKNSF